MDLQHATATATMTSVRIQAKIFRPGTRTSHFKLTAPSEQVKEVVSQLIILSAPS